MVQKKVGLQKKFLSNSNDCEIEVLEHHCDALIDQIAKTKRKILLEELNCFKEVLQLHRRLLDNDQP